MSVRRPTVQNNRQKLCHSGCLSCATHRGQAGVQGRRVLAALADILVLLHVLNQKRHQAIGDSTNLKGYVTGAVALRSKPC